MKVDKKDLEKQQIELTVEISPEEMEQYLDLAAKKLSSEIEIKGFRKGKVPRDVLEAKLGKGRIFEEGANIAFMKTYRDVVLEQKLEVVGEPEVKVEKLAPENPFIYKAVVGILPEITLPEIGKTKVKRKEVKIDDKELKKSLDQLQKSRAKIKVVDREAKQGDQVEIDFKTFKGNVPVDKGESKNHPLTIGEGYFIPGFEEHLIDMKKGDKKEFNLEFPKDYHEKSLAGSEVLFKVEMKEIREQELPKLDDKFAKELGQFKDLKDLEDKIKENLKKEKEKKEEQRLEMEAVRALLKEIEMEVPDSLTKEEQKKMLQEMQNMVEGQGGKFDQYLESIKKTEEQLLESFSEQALERVKTGLLLREIAKEEKIEVGDAAVAAEIEKLSKAYQHNPEVMKQIQSDEYKEYTRGILQNREVFKLLKKKMVK
ncbi:trigger factor [Patescibacteria group bacterium]|nr:trigger factor [Patescibacteria group bacterium]